MSTELGRRTRQDINPAGGPLLPAVIAQAGDHAARRFIEFHRHHPQPQHEAGLRQGRRGLPRMVRGARPHPARHRAGTRRRLHRAVYPLQSRPHRQTALSRHRHAVRLADQRRHHRLFNPAASVRGPKHLVKRGKTPVLTAEEARRLLDSIDTDSLIGLRDRALIAVMVYSFARVGAALAMKVEDYCTEGRRAWFRLHEKGGKRHEVRVSCRTDYEALTKPLEAVLKTA
jgi:integrase/recombinase XerD